MTPKIILLDLKNKLQIYILWYQNIALTCFIFQTKLWITVLKRIWSKLSTHLFSIENEPQTM